MDVDQNCRLFRQLIYDPSDRKVSKQQHFMNGHERTCVACLEWMLREVADIQAQHDAEEYVLDSEDLGRLRRTKDKLLRRQKALSLGQASSSDLGEIDPTEQDLAEIAQEEQPHVINPVPPEEGEATTCSA